VDNISGIDRRRESHIGTGKGKAREAEEKLEGYGDLEVKETISE
jgi:hypothetical protein